MSIKRNMGIDLLRIVSMGMVVFLHVLNRGGILGTATPLSMNYKIAWAFETAAYCAVNCYGLISGYVGYCAKFRFSNLIILWFRVVWYTLIITLLFAVYTNGVIGKQEIINAILPGLTEQYWYFTAYLGMFFFIPVLNMFINNASRIQVKVVVIACIILFSVFPTVFRRDIFYLNEGYSAFWLGILYLIGGYIAKYDVGKTYKKSLLLVGYFITVFISWMVKMLMDKLSLQINGSLPEKDLLITYLSPTILAAAIILVIFFANLKICVKIENAIKLLAPLSFSVYLIHFNPLIKEYVLQDRFAYLVDFSPIKFIVAILCVVGIIFGGCLVLDSIRETLFKKFKIKEKVVNIENKVSEKV